MAPVTTAVKSSGMNPGDLALSIPSLCFFWSLCTQIKRAHFAVLPVLPMLSFIMNKLSQKRDTVRSVFFVVLCILSVYWDKFCTNTQTLKHMS